MRLLRKRARLFAHAQLFVIVSVIGCAGSGDSTATPTGLGGTITTTDYVIPAGTTQTATSDLKVLASGKIDIEGTLLINPGVSVALLSKKALIVNGNIKAVAPPAKLTRQQAGSEAPFVATGDSDSYITHIDLSEGSSPVYISSAGAGGEVLKVGSVKGGNGHTSFVYEENGQDAPSIEIGTNKAVTAARNGGNPDASAPATVELTGLIDAGLGGGGFTDQKGVTDALQVTLKGSNGGAGGSVNIVATSAITGQGAEIRGGFGGVGGACVATVPAATQPRQTGLNCVATLGDGGRGGSVNLSAKTVAGVTVQPGQGGDEGRCVLDGANGGPGGGNGGSTTVTLGNTGTAGTSNVASVPPPAFGTVSITLGGGDGTNSDDNRYPGGKGGDITVKNPSGKKNYTLYLMYSAGGDGFGMCGAPPYSAGSKGGDGGTVMTAGLPYSLKSGGFGGGKGGAGSPAGTGGSAGKDENGKLLGKNGVDGQSCTGSGLTVTGTSSVPGGNEFLEINTGDSTLFGTGTSQGNQVTLIPEQGGTSTSVPLSNPPTDSNNPVASTGATTRAVGTGTAYVACQTNVIMIVDLQQKKQVGTINVVAGYGPVSLGLDASTGKLYAAVDTGLLVYDTNNGNKQVASIPTLTGSAIAINSSLHKLYLVGGAGNQIAVIDLIQNKEIKRIALPAYSGVVALNPVTGNVYASLYYQGKIEVINGSTDTITTSITVGTGPWGITCDSMRNRIYVANYNGGSQPGSVMQISGALNTVTSTVTVGKGPTGIAMDEAADKIFVANAVDGTITTMNGN